MAIKFTSKTPIKAADSTWEYGAIQDATSNQDGTPVDRKTYNDALTFFSKLMDEAGITPNDLFDNATNGYQLWDAFIRHVYPFEGPNKNIQSGSLPLGNHIDVSDVTESVFVVSDPNNNGPLQSINDIAGYSDFRSIILFFNDPVQISSAGNLDVGLSFYDVQTNTPYVFRKYGTEWYLESSIYAIIQILNDNYYTKTASDNRFAQISQESLKGAADATIDPGGNGWSDVTFRSGATTPFAFRKDTLGYVRLYGALGGGTSGTVAVTMPSGYKPDISGDQYFPGMKASEKHVNRIWINGNGEVAIEFDNNTASDDSITALDNVIYYAGF